MSYLKLLFARNPGRLDLSIVCFSAMETVISIEYNELIRDGEFEMKTQIQDFLDSKVDEWKFSVTTHLWSDHYFRLLRRHFGPVSHSFDKLPYPSPSQSRSDSWKLWQPLSEVREIKRSSSKDSLKLRDGF